MLSHSGVDKQRATEIARTYLEQQHSVHNVEVISLEKGIWVVKAETHSASGESVKKVGIDTKSGRIISLE